MSSYDAYEIITVYNLNLTLDIGIDLIDEGVTAERVKEGRTIPLSFELCEVTGMDELLMGTLPLGNMSVNFVGLLSWGLIDMLLMLEVTCSPFAVECLELSLLLGALSENPPAETMSKCDDNQLWEE